MLCFTLLETVDEWSLKSADGVITLEELCGQMLKTLFEVHDMARNEVGKIINHIYYFIVT